MQRGRGESAISPAEQFAFDYAAREGIGIDQARSRIAAEQQTRSAQREAAAAEREVSSLGFSARDTYNRYKRAGYSHTEALAAAKRW
jgi:hypothetical protein